MERKPNLEQGINYHQPTPPSLEDLAERYNGQGSKLLNNRPGTRLTLAAVYLAGGGLGLGEQITDLTQRALDRENTRIATQYTIEEGEDPSARFAAILQEYQERGVIQLRPPKSMPKDTSVLVREGSGGEVPVIQVTPTLIGSEFVYTGPGDLVPDFGPFEEIKGARLLQLEETDQGYGNLRQVQQSILEIARDERVNIAQEESSAAVIELEEADGDHSAYGLIVNPDGSFYWVMAVNEEGMLEPLGGSPRIYFLRGEVVQVNDDEIRYQIDLPEGTESLQPHIRKVGDDFYFSPGGGREEIRLEDGEDSGVGLLASLTGLQVHSEPFEQPLSWTVVDLETDENSDGISDRVVRFEDGNEFPLLPESEDAYVSPEGTLVVLDHESKTWEEVAPIYTMDQLLEQVPSQDEMLKFLRLGGIVRSIDTRGNLNELGVGEVDTSPRQSTRDIEAIIWGQPVLANFELNGKSIVSEFLPIITTAGTESQKPVLLYCWLGAERISGRPIVGNESGMVSDEHMGVHRAYPLIYDHLRKYFKPGHQIRIPALVSVVQESLEKAGDPSASLRARINYLYIVDYLSGDRKELQQLASGIQVPDGTIVMPGGEIRLTKTTISD